MTARRSVEVDRVAGSYVGPNALFNLSVCLQDDMLIHVFNYNTLERVHMFEAHTDYIRGIAVHPTQPYVLSCSGTEELHPL